MTLSKAEILETLEGDTHALWRTEFLDAVNAAFATNIQPVGYDANPGDPKGLTLENGAACATGISSYDLAFALCEALKVSPAGKLGRGSQVRACVEAIRSADV